MGEDSNASMEEKQIQAKFITKLPELFKVPSTAFAIPSRLNRYGLSEVINTLLGLDEIQPFDFFINDELLRTSLENFLLTKNISAESVVSIEYVKAILPPKIKNNLPHDDWISAVNGSLNDFILSGSYDKLGRIFNKNGLCKKVLVGHNDTIRELCILKSYTKNNELKIVTASDDNTLRLWNIDDFKSLKEEKKKKKGGEESLEEMKNKEVHSCVLFKGHSNSVQCVDSSNSGEEICSGGWDGSIRIWKTKLHEEGEGEGEGEGEEEIQGQSQKETSAKKRKGQNGVVCTPQKVVSGSVLLSGHTQCVTSVCYSDDTIFSSSHDYSIRLWDVETTMNTLTMVGTKSIFCLSVNNKDKNKLCTGGGDACVRIWDSRSNNVSPTLQLMSHQAWISKVCWHPKNEFHLLSASYDGKIKLWDTRSKIPLNSIDAHKSGKVLCADWFSPNGIVSGGDDNQLNIFSNIDI